MPSLPRFSRQDLKPYLAEFLGTALLVLIGDGVIAQCLLSDWANGSWLSINIAWGAAVALTSYLASPSPTVNPAVTLASALIRPSPEQTRQLPGKLAAQFLGGFLGAVLVYAEYYSSIKAWDPEYTIPGGQILSPKGHHSAGIFATYPSSNLATNWEAALQEVLGTALLMFGALAISDSTNAKRFAAPQLSMFLLLVVIGAAMGWQTGYAVNPARDFGPRLFSAMVYGREVFTAAGYYMFVPLVAPVVGAVLGAVTYDAFLYEGDDSVVVGLADKFGNGHGALRLEDDEY